MNVSQKDFKDYKSNVEKTIVRLVNHIDETQERLDDLQSQINELDWVQRSVEERLDELEDNE